MRDRPLPDDDLAGERDEVEVAVAGADFHSPCTREREHGIRGRDVTGSGGERFDYERSDALRWEADLYPRDRTPCAPTPAMP